MHAGQPIGERFVRSETAPPVLPIDQLAHAVHGQPAHDRSGVRAARAPTQVEARARRHRTRPCRCAPGAWAARSRTGRRPAARTSTRSLRVADAHQIARSVGRQLGKVASSSSRVTSFGSPTLRPPMAKPGGEVASRGARACRRRSANRPPWTSANSAWSVRRLRAPGCARHQRWVRSSAASASRACRRRTEALVERHDQVGAQLLPRPRRRIRA